jgi:hypothetical protein
MGTKDVIPKRLTVYPHGKPSVHEHDVCVKKNKALILSDYSIIEKAEQANINLNTSYYAPKWLSNNVSKGFSARTALKIKAFSLFFINVLEMLPIISSPYPL